MKLLGDGLLEFVRELNSDFAVGIDPDKIYRLTTKGREFINRWLSAKTLE
jgi:DNA-binding PadR family transcriptional regulator